MDDIHGERGRAEGFGADAERYDRTRPGYPEALVDWLTGDTPGRAVDVGCGTGQLSRLLRDAGWNVVGVEIDPRMADVARGHGIDVQVAAFEEWSGTGPFDLVTSAQAWHWIDPAIGYDKAASLLRPGGRLAMIWNSYGYDADVAAVFADVFGRHAPELLDAAVSLGLIRLDHEELEARTAARLGPAFSAPETHAFDHHRTVTIDAWIDEATTHSPIAALPASTRTRLFDELARGLSAATDGSIRVDHTARLTSATRI
ncbi:MAG: class I SAM-dependent methyltransferase [Ilumatobacter sp.]|uniref:class I SAM-dependent methyltransferase n=1 Tax=Ilumatobacter sp. TaxID=1967498 RepID=UPI002629A2DE|nr:class I SAM-dependent methyltransferase [Ilumatobacter sp.]MDJ0769001.1 class I SAM-dependent methyltransferase [Ilumatobacter sp.]